MPKTVFVHDNFIQVGGGERAGEELARCLPEADMVSSVVVPERLTPYIRSRQVKTTWMQRLPAMKKLYRHYFLLYPFAMRNVDLSAYDSIVSSCYGMAKMVRKKPGALHICYCHSPTRWIWRFDDYLEKENFGRLRKSVLRGLVNLLKNMDLAAAAEVDHFIANSHIVAERIRRYYGREAHVLHPPIRVDRFTPSEQVGDFYLIVSRLAAYKRIELAIAACEQLGRPLKIVGQGPHRAQLEKLAGPNTEFLGRLPDTDVTSLMATCRAFLFPGEEDFGLTPLEVSASGRPCIAFGQGGALETIVPGLNGIFFSKPTAESLAESIERGETMQWDSAAIRKHATKFDASHFERRFVSLVNELTEHHLGLAAQKSA